MFEPSLISFASWRRVLLGAGVGAVFGAVLTAFLALTGALSIAPASMPAARVLAESLAHACQQLVPWLLLWLIVLPALLRVRFAQPWLALVLYTALAIVLIPRAIDVTIESTSQLVAVGIFALVTGLPIVRANDVWLPASFLVALHIVTVSVAGMPFGSSAGYGVFDSRLTGDVLLTGDRMGPVFGIFGMLGLAWLAGAMLQHQRMVFAGTERLWRSRRDALTDFAFGLAIAAAAVSVMFMAMLVTQQSRVAGVTPSISALSASLTTSLPAAVAMQCLYSYVLVSVLMLLVRRGWIAVLLATAVAISDHLMAPGTTMFTAAGAGALTLAGGVAFVATGRLWMPIALIYGWRLFEGPVFGFASGGMVTAQSWFRQDILQYTALSGGVHGPDASVFGLVAKLLMAGAVIAFARKEQQ